MCVNSLYPREKYIDFALLFLGDLMSLFQQECPFMIISSISHPEIKNTHGKLGAGGVHVYLTGLMRRFGIG